MLKAEQVDSAQALAAAQGDLVLPSLVLRKPEVAVETGDKEQLNWSLRKLGDDLAAKAVTPGIGSRCR
jgi:hypothetical protein